MELFNKVDIVQVEGGKAKRLIITPNTLPGLGTLDDFLWVTSISGSVEPNYQVLYSFDAAVYLNSFTERLSTFELRGVYAPTGVDCQEAPTDNKPAYMQMYWTYNIVDATAGGEEPTVLTLSVHNLVIKGFLIKAQMSRYSKETLDGHEFVLIMLGYIDNGKVRKSELESSKNKNTRPDATVRQSDRAGIRTFSVGGQTFSADIGGNVLNTNPGGSTL